MSFEIRRYTADDAEAWNRFVATSRQGTFLFNRGYMDYHADRFTDCSLIATRKGKVRAVLPANRKDKTLVSHGGLTYGGLLTDNKLKVTDVREIFRAINAYLKTVGIQRVIYKAMPWIYHRIPAEEDLYALTEDCHARLLSREISSTIILSRRLPFEESRKSGMRKAKREGVTCRESDDLEVFWNILNNNLSQKYGTHPVHTLDELRLLRHRFPKEIRLFMAYKDSTPVGGTLVYDTGQVVHTQYISASPEGKACGALDLLFDKVINETYADRLIFDFGKSTENAGHYLNEHLIFQKEGFGGRGVCYDTYAYDIV